MTFKLVLATILLIPGLACAQDTMADRLRQAIVEEEANQNLEKAIQDYQTIVARFDEERKIAATALFRLAECYRKQGRKEQAVAAYQRVLKEFPDQADLAAASRTQLTKTYGINLNQEDRAVSEARQRYRATLLQEMELVHIQMNSTQKRINAGLAAKTDLIPFQMQILDLERALAVVDAGGVPPAQSIRK